MKQIVSFVICLILTQYVQSQDNFSSFSESEIGIEYDVTSQYSHSFGIENRNIIYENGDLTYTVKQIDISHISTLAIAGNKNIGLGVKYRFKEVFDSDSEDELRFLQQLQWKNLWQDLPLKSRLRMEERFYSDVTKYRIRYRLAASFPLSADNSTSFNTETESLLQLSLSNKPEYEQRFTTTYSWLLTATSQIELGVQYRLADFTQNIGHELFIVAGLDIAL
ncbi:DUF2490 domain-containing protein [Nonlabens antarcticus]|uniref:DUF2490 domain-containing protein n=1 Tax=Nonlabens antarcticus TaxID=392714 RepID=UPI0018915A78|nr:DUF2490 domain-containing protein [Nonlabens antarcticus]